jgi:hypothetical protein
MDFDLGPGISYFWGRDVVQEEIIESLGGVAKLGLSLKSHDRKVESDVEKAGQYRVDKGVFLFFFPTVKSK